MFVAVSTLKGINTLKGTSTLKGTGIAENTGISGRWRFVFKENKYWFLVKLNNNCLEKLLKKRKNKKYEIIERNLRKSVDKCQTINYNEYILKIYFHIDILMKERYGPPK